MSGVWLAGESANEQQQTGSWQMKVGNEGVDHFELVGWVDKNVSGTFLRLELKSV